MPRAQYDDVDGRAPEEAYRFAWTGGVAHARVVEHDDSGCQQRFEHEQLANELQRLRPWVRQNLHTYDERRDFFRDAVAKALA